MWGGGKSEMPATGGEKEPVRSRNRADRAKKKKGDVLKNETGRRENRKRKKKRRAGVKAFSEGHGDVYSKRGVKKSGVDEKLQSDAIPDHVSDSVV